MEERTIHPTPVDSVTIRGESHINHRIRKMLGLTLAEYAVAEFIYNQFKEAESDIPIQKWYEHFGEDYPRMVPVIIGLREKGIINDEYPPKTVLFTKDKWNQYFDLDADFEKVWAILHKRGSKEAARKNYLNCRKKHSAEFLQECSMKYIVTKNLDEPQYILHMSTFFGRDKHYLNDFGAAYKPKTKPEEKKQSIGNMYDENNRK